MKMKLLALLTAFCLLFAMTAYAEDAAPQEEIEATQAEAGNAGEPAEEPEELEGETEGATELTTARRWFVNQYNNVRGRTVTYYDNVYAINHGEYGLTPFADAVPSEYFVIDESGAYAIAPVVLDIVDAMRQQLYGGDVGELGLLYGQYCERARGNGGKVGFTGIHEGIDFIAGRGKQLYAILGGVVTRAGDSNGTVAVYNEEYDVTLLYLHCEKISVRRGDEIEAGTPIALEGKKGSGSAYTHVELRDGRHTSSSPYRDVKVESDCPYSVMLAALSVQASDRETVTYAAALEEQKRLEEEEAARRAEEARIAEEAERMRLEAEAEAARLAEEARLAAEAEQLQAEAEATPEVELVDSLPGATEGYGFAGETPDAQPTPAAEPTAVPEATLPPANP